MNHGPDDDIGMRLRQLRRARGLSQQDLASGDISISYVSLIETGKRVPSESVLQTLAERVGSSVTFLRTGRDDSALQELELKVAFADMALRHGSAGEALQLYSEALASRPLLGAAVVRRARLGQALALARLGRLEAAVQMLTDLYNDPAAVPGSVLWTQTAVALCDCYTECGDHVLSVELGEAAIRRLDLLGLDATDDHVQLGTALLNSYLQWGDLAQANILAERLRNWTGSAEPPGDRTSVYWNAALVAHSRGSTPEALALAERALALATRTDGVRYRAMLRDAYGSLLLESGPADAERALALFGEAQTTLLDVGTTAEQARCETHIALAHLRLGNPAAACGHAGRAIGLLRTEDRVDAVDARSVLAQAQFDLGERPAAQETLRAAVRQLQQVPRSRTSSRAWRRIGDLWNQHGFTHDALTAYQQALSDAGVHGLPPLFEHAPTAAHG